MRNTHATRAQAGMMAVFVIAGRCFLCSLALLFVSIAVNSPAILPGIDDTHTPPKDSPRRTRTPAPRTHPLLEQLAQWYPHLFGTQTVQPLKRGIFQDLLAAHPDVLDKDQLKIALSVHTRSTRYLNAVAAGLQRCDLQGQHVEAMAPEHIYHAMLEVFRRRQLRAPEDLSAQLRHRIVRAFEASGLTREAYAERVRTRDERTNAILDEALAEAGARAAKDEALQRTFAASGLGIHAFAEMYGLDARAVMQALRRTR